MSPGEHIQRIGARELLKTDLPDMVLERVVIEYLQRLLVNAGARVESVRERSFQTREVVVDDAAQGVTYEVDLSRPAGERIVAFIEEPRVVRAFLEHLSLWDALRPRAPTVAEVGPTELNPLTRSTSARVRNGCGA